MNRDATADGPTEPSEVPGLLGPLHHPLPSELRTCSYFDDRQALDEAYLAAEVPPAGYRGLMDLNFRRSGVLIYRPRCPSCSLCRQIRVATDTIKPSKSQRRAIRKNNDVGATCVRPQLTAEKAALYLRYIDGQHPGSSQPKDIRSLRDFLYSSCVETAEVEYRLPDGTLIAVSILDVAQDALSSVYHFFDPSHARRSLGVYSVFAECQIAREQGIPWYYLGYWIPGCRTMEYKAQYDPHEVLVDGHWTPGPVDDEGAPRSS